MKDKQASAGNGKALAARRPIRPKRAVNYDFLCHVKNRCGAGEKRELIPFGGGDRKRISLHRYLATCRSQQQPEPAIDGRFN